MAVDTEQDIAWLFQVNEPEVFLRCLIPKGKLGTILKSMQCYKILENVNLSNPEECWIEACFQLDRSLEKDVYFTDIDGQQLSFQIEANLLDKYNNNKKAKSILLRTVFIRLFGEDWEKLFKPCILKAAFNL